MCRKSGLQKSTVIPTRERSEQGDLPLKQNLVIQNKALSFRGAQRRGTCFSRHEQSVLHKQNSQPCDIRHRETLAAPIKCPAMRYYVYIMSSKSRVLYVGVTGFLLSPSPPPQIRRRRSLHQQIPRPSPRLLPSIPKHRRRHRPRDRNQKLAPRKEGRANPRKQPHLGGPSQPTGANQSFYAWTGKQVPPRLKPPRNDKDLGCSTKLHVIPNKTLSFKTKRSAFKTKPFIRLVPQNQTSSFKTKPLSFRTKLVIQNETACHSELNVAIQNQTLAVQNQTSSFKTRPRRSKLDPCHSKIRFVIPTEGRNLLFAGQHSAANVAHAPNR